MSKKKLSDLELKLKKVAVLANETFATKEESKAGDNRIAAAIGVDTSVEFVDLGLPSGTLWAKCNIGATEETGYGGFWQYGKGAADFFETAGEDMYTGKEDPLSLQYDAAAQVMGNPWHMPTKAQFEELIANTTYTWETNFNGSGVGGAKFTAANGNYIFLPASGLPYDDGEIDDRNDLGSYMSSTPADGVTGNPYWWWCLELSTQRSPRIHIEKTTGELMGLSVRPVMDGTIEQRKADKKDTYTKTEVDTIVQDAQAGSMFQIYVDPEDLHLKGKPTGYGTFEVVDGHLILHQTEQA